MTRATDLKQIFSKYGKVIGAKVVTNTRTPGARCYGYVTMASPKDATECIEHLHRTELHGRMISVERAKSDLSGPPKSNTTSGCSKSSSSAAPKKNSSNDTDTCSISTGSNKKDGGISDGNDSKKLVNKDKNPKDTKKSSGNEKSSGDDKKIKDVVSGDIRNRRETQRYDRKVPSKSKERGRNFEGSNFPASGRGGGSGAASGAAAAAVRRTRERDVLSYQKIREARERQRLREKERELREEERRRRDIRRRQREEEQRLAREREKLQLERERIEKEKAELMRIERERQKQDWEKIEQERLELKRQQRKYG